MESSALNCNSWKHVTVFDKYLIELLVLKSYDWNHMAGFKNKLAMNYSLTNRN